MKGFERMFRCEDCDSTDVSYSDMYSQVQDHIGNHQGYRCRCNRCGQEGVMHN